MMCPLRGFRRKKINGPPFLFGKIRYVLVFYEVYVFYVCKVLLHLSRRVFLQIFGILDAPVRHLGYFLLHLGGKSFAKLQVGPHCSRLFTEVAQAYSWQCV